MWKENPWSDLKYCPEFAYGNSEKLRPSMSRRDLNLKSPEYKSGVL
jgi:hypothetical protein